MPESETRQLVKYLRDAYAMEVQALDIAKSAARIAGDPTLEQIYQGHVMETTEHEHYARERREARGESLSDERLALEEISEHLGLAVERTLEQTGAKE